MDRVCVLFLNLKREEKNIVVQNFILCDVEGSLNWDMESVWLCWFVRGSKSVDLRIENCVGRNERRGMNQGV